MYHATMARKHSEQLRSFILRSGLSQAELSRRVKIPRSTLNRFSRGECGLSLETVDALCRALRLKLIRREPPAGKRPKAEEQDGLFARASIASLSPKR